MWHLFEGISILLLVFWIVCHGGAIDQVRRRLNRLERLSGDSTIQRVRPEAERTARDN